MTFVLKLPLSHALPYDNSSFYLNIYTLRKATLIIMKDLPHLNSMNTGACPTLTTLLMICSNHDFSCLVFGLSYPLWLVTSSILEVRYPVLRMLYGKFKELGTVEERQASSNVSF